MKTQQLAQGLEPGLREALLRQVRCMSPQLGTSVHAGSNYLVPCFTHGCYCSPRLPWHGPATKSFDSMWAATCRHLCQGCANCAALPPQASIAQS